MSGAGGFSRKGISKHTNSVCKRRGRDKQLDYTINGGVDIGSVRKSQRRTCTKRYFLHPGNKVTAIVLDVTLVGATPGDFVDILTLHVRGRDTRPHITSYRLG